MELFLVMQGSSLIIPLMRNAATHTSSPGYAAFISYRHLPRDAEVACEVQRAIEEYRLPRACCAGAPSLSIRQTGQMLSGRRRAWRLLILCPAAFGRRWRLRGRLWSFARRKRGKALGCDGKLRCSSSSTGASASFACWPQAVPRKAFRPF